MIEFFYVVGSEDVEIHVTDQPVVVVSIDEFDAAVEDLYAEREREHR